MSSRRSRWCSAVLLGGTVIVTACTDADDGEPAQMLIARITLTNVSAPGALRPSDGSAQDILVAPALWALHEQPEALLRPGVDAKGTSLELLAEDGEVRLMQTELWQDPDVVASGVVPADAAASYSADPLVPGESVAFEVEYETSSVHRVSFAAMFIQSNDVALTSTPDGFVLPDEPGITDVTGDVELWDVGTEQNEELGIGPNQAPRQSGGNVGPDEHGVVTRIETIDSAGWPYPAVETFLVAVIEVRDAES